MDKKLIYENKDLELKVTQIDTSIHKDEYITIEFGKVKLSINKKDDVRDIAVMIDGAITGVLWDDKKIGPNDTDWTTHEAVDAIKLHYLKRDQEKYKTIKEAFGYLKEND